MLADRSNHFRVTGLVVWVRLHWSTCATELAQQYLDSNQTSGTGPVETNQQNQTSATGPSELDLDNPAGHVLFLLFFHVNLSF